MQAAECAMAMLSECGKYDVGRGEEAVSLRLHCGIGRWRTYNKTTRYMLMLVHVQIFQYY